MTSFSKELLGGRGFSLVPLEGLHSIIFLNPWLLLPNRSVIAYARKQNRSAIFEWRDKEQGWFWYVSEFLRGWDKKLKMVNLPASTKKGSASKSTKPKPAKKGGDISKACLDLVPYKGGLPPTGNIFLESTPPPSTKTRST